MCNVNHDQQICVRCVMDRSDSDIEFDDEGVCNHCHDYRKANQLSERELAQFQRQLTDVQARKDTYNCVIGVSGGLDSTFLLIHAVQDLGLRPLAVHVDNGWNTGLANTNIFNLCNRLGVTLHTLVLDWEEFRKMQISILEAGVPDLEAPTDLFINYALRQVANKFGIKYVLSGTNPQTEAVMGSNWSYGQRDPLYLSALYRRTWGKNPVLLPFRNWYVALAEQVIGSLQIIRPLKYTTYGKTLATERCAAVANWQEYPRKHGESFITRFYQDYFLPERFGFDKLRAHLSCLVLNGDLTRESALRILDGETKTRGAGHEADIQYFCTKLRIPRDTFDRYMTAPRRFHGDYPSIKSHFLFRALKTLKRRRLLPKTIAGYMAGVVSK